VKRTKQHILNFTRLYDEIKAGQIDEGWLQYLEWKHNLFPNINYRVYRSDYRGSNASLPLAVGL
ncbi:MAG: DUF1957 domain-containing protein, partial [Syntrophomonadaceae bacterium]|nr:DUF1957 domain-containing protein [Syntrophomonadaceae bacterium]